MEILYSILGCIITSVCSIVCVIITNKHSLKQKQLEINENKQKDIQEIIKMRPEFEITKYKTYFDESGYFESKDFQMDILMCFSDVDINIYKDMKKYVRVEYEFTNIGEGIIEYVDFIAQYRNLFLFNLLDEKSNTLENTLFDSHKSILHYLNRIHKGDSIKIRLWYHKDAVRESLLTNTAGIGFKSFDKNYWVQNLNAPRNMLEESVLYNEYEYNRKVSGNYSLF